MQACNGEMDAPVHRALAESAVPAKGRNLHRAHDGSATGFSDWPRISQPVLALCF